jgi:predicted nucleotidyltransferase
MTDKGLFDVARFDYVPVAKGNSSPESDIDILVESEEDTGVCLKNTGEV